MPNSIPPERKRWLRTWALGTNPAELREQKNGACSSSLIDLASNDYLGLSTHPKLQEAAKAAMSTDGVGSGGSRLVTGTRPIHKKLEEDLANWLEKDQVLLFPSGFQANIAGVIALANRFTNVLADRLIHHSLLIGVKASGANLQRFKHNDLNDLEKRLRLCRTKQLRTPPLVITESLFSMEGSSPNLEELGRLCAYYEANLFVDEAHSLGVLGLHGKGLCQGLTTPISMISGTFGKAFGSGGAFLATTNKIAEDLLQNSGAFRYTTALAPPLAAAAREGLRLIKANPNWGKELQKESLKWREGLTSEGWPTPPGNGQILSLVIGKDQKALEKQQVLESAGLLCVAIRPPTVPEGTSRLRLVLRRNLPKQTFNKLICALREQ